MKKALKGPKKPDASQSLQALSWLSAVCISAIALQSGCGRFEQAFRASTVSRRSTTSLDSLDSQSIKLTVKPSALGLYPGDEVQVEVSASQDLGDSLSLDQTKIKFETSHSEVIQVSGAGKVKGITEGEATITATYNGAKASVTVKVLKRAKTNCDSKNGYLALVEPQLQTRCIGCHGTNGQPAARTNFSLNGPSPDQSGVDGNFDLVKRKIGVDDPAKSLLIAKASGRIFHGGGEIFPPESAEISGFLSWASVEKECQQAQKVVAIELVSDGNTLEAGASRTYQLNARTGTGVARNVTALAEWTVRNAAGQALTAENGSLVATPDGMKLTLLKEGERWRIEAKFENLSTGADLQVVARPNPQPACPGFIKFRSNVAPIFRTASCGPGCHFAGGGASGAYQILADDQTCEAAYENWTAARSRILFATPENSPILKKPSGQTSHGGALRISTSSAEYAALKAWVSQEATCKAANPNDNDLGIGLLCRRLLTKITLSPATPALRVGESVTLSAVGTYDDQSELPLAGNSVIWFSSNGSVLSVDVTGKLKALATGSARIKATSGTVTAEKSITVLAARTLIGLDVTPAMQSVAKGQMASFTVKNRFSNGDVEARSTPVNWTIANPEIATLTSQGILAKNIGSTNITATDPTCTACTKTFSLTVTAALVTGIEISPNPAALTVGITTKLSLMQIYSDGTKTPINVLATWTSSDSGSFSVDQLGNATGLKAGAGTVTVTYNSRSKSADVFVIQAGECSSFQSFATNVEPMLQNNCVGCHSNGQQGSLFMVLRPTDQKLLNWSELKERIDNTTLAQTTLIKRVMRVAHPGAAFLATGSQNRIKLDSWIQSDIACQISSRSSNLARSSGKVLYNRLAALFPNAVSTGNDTKPLFFEDFDALRAKGSFRLIAQPERSLSPLAMNLWRQKANQLCNTQITGQDSDRLFQWTPDLLLTTESVPTDPALSVTLAAVRRAWGYPYPQNHAYVAAIRDFYNGAKADGATDLAARKGVCVAVLTAPEFLLGNPGDEDALRRLKLALLGKSPTAAEYAGFRQAANKSAYARSLVQNIQSGATREQYLDQVSDWHRIALGLRDFFDSTGSITRPSINFERNRATGVGGVSFTTVSKPISGFDRAIQWDREINTTTEHDFSESCDTGLEQPFDPRTGELIWQHFNPVVSQWETIGSWKKVNGIWQAVAGQITLDSTGTTKATTLEDIRLTQRVTMAGRVVNKYIGGGLIDTPVDLFAGGNRRLIRKNPLGIVQKGYSTVRLWWSREPVKVCNTLSRYLATCAYRPSSASLQSTTATNLNWNAFTASAPRLGTGGKGGRDTFAHPTILQGFSCGMPNGTMIAKVGQADYQELMAFPKGYTSDSGTIDQSLLQDLAINVNDVASFESDSNDRFTAVTSVIARNSASTWAEDKAFGRLLDDLTKEPIRLLRDIISNNQDYKLLLTAPYTIGGPELDLYLRSQGYFLPLYPSGYTVGTSQSPLRFIRQSNIPPIPTGWLKNSLGKMPDESAHRYDLALGEVRPRTMSGIMTQMAFLAPVKNDGKVRSISARIHERLLCGLPNEFVPRLDDQALQLHDRYISVKGDNGAQHLDRSKGCYSCHVTLDPIASVYSKAFLAVQKSPGYSEARIANIFGINNETYGLRGNDEKSKGALLGTEVTGIAHLSDVLANSKEFSTCVVKTAFEHLFGRKPVSSDMGLVQRVTDQFMGSTIDYNYNKMIEELAASPEFLREE
jgi:uncharacterized protein YjdB